MRWIAVFDDNAEARQVRMDLAEAHSAYLASHADSIRLAGGLRPAPDAFWTGGLWIIDADTREDAERLCEDDPYFVEGLRAGYRLMIWGRAPCYGEPGSIPL